MKTKNQIEEVTEAVVSDLPPSWQEKMAAMQQELEAVVADAATRLAAVREEYDVAAAALSRLKGESVMATKAAKAHKATKADSAMEAEIVAMAAKDKLKRKDITEKYGLEPLTASRLLKKMVADKQIKSHSSGAMRYYTV
jgi:BMFP domain-containing protein YqiC